MEAWQKPQTKLIPNQHQHPTRYGHVRLSVWIICPDVRTTTWISEIKKFEATKFGVIMCFFFTTSKFIT